MKNDSFIEHIHTYIAQHNLLPSGAKVIIGLSGGPDSVFLLHMLVELRKKYDFNLIAAHLNHEWRPEASQDVHFCQNLAKNFSIQFVTSKISELGLSLKFNGSKEEIARKARRSFFDQVKKEHGAHLVALAHHAQDQQETFFIRLLRGATLSGLTSMKAQQDYYIRPLLRTNKEDILNYLHAHNIAYLTDSTNDSEIFLRNRIRMHVLPALKKCDTRFDANFLNTITRLQETENFLQEITEDYFYNISMQEHDTWHIDTEKLLALHPIMRYRIMLFWLCKENVSFPVSQSFFDEMLKFLHTKENKMHHMHETWKLVKKKNSVYLQK